MTERVAESLVSVVTPTFPGRERELARCMERVLDLDWPWVQHVVVSDRTELAVEINREWQEAHADRWAAVADAHDHGFGSFSFGNPWSRQLTFVQINESWRNPTTEKSIGAVPWYVGSLLAMGEFVAFCGDDDELLPQHVRRGVEAMREHEALWSVSQVEFRVGGEPQFVIGTVNHTTDGIPWFDLGSMDATGIMCHRDALQVQSWTANGEDGADYRLVRDWGHAGLRGTFVPEVTGIHNDGWVVGKNGRPDRPR